MERLSTLFLQRKFYAILFFCGWTFSLAGQQPYSEPQAEGISKTAWADESIFRERLSRDGLSDSVINRLVEQRRILVAQGRKVEQTVLTKRTRNVLPGVCAACQDMGGENGWGAWQGEPGVNDDVAGLVFAAPGAPFTPRFNLTTGAGIDGETPGLNPGDPTIPVVAPGFGNFSLQLGQIETNGQGGGCDTSLNGTGCAERIIYPLIVGPTDTNFVYTYAFVMENPGTTHTYANMPFVEFMILDSHGDTVPCAYQRYAASDTIPGMYVGNHLVDLPSNPIYKPWTIVGVNLSAYVGQALTVVITNADCQLGGHFAQSYWDFSCGTISNLVAPTCTNGRPDTLSAPASDPNNPYTYIWHRNGNPNPIGNTQIITAFTQPGDTFTVDVSPASGCGWHLLYVPQHYKITAAFSFAGSCGRMTFTDQSTSPQPTDPITSWQWSFPGGTPSTSSSQHPGVVTFSAAGTYTVTLIANSSSGCTDTIKHTFTVGGSPTAGFTSTTPCLGAASLLTNGSVAAAGDPITGYSWTMTGGTPASSTGVNPSTTFNTPGSHTVTLIVTTQQGCRDTITKQVSVYHLPVALFNDRDSGCAPVCHSFTDLSHSVDGAITNWQWSFPGGVPASSISQNPANICYNTPGTYNASLMVTTTYGCKNTIQQNNIITVYPIPKADFTMTESCGTMTATDRSTTTNPHYPVAGWNWSFPGGAPASSTSQSPGVITYPPGTYMVTLQVTSSTGCVNTMQHAVTIIGPPSAAFTNNSPCIGAATTVNGSSSVGHATDPITAWSWSFPGGVPPMADGVNVSTVYSSAGTYTVTLMVTTRQGCKDSILKPIIVYHNPTPLFNDRDSGCTPICHSFTDLSSSADGNIIKWQWAFPGGSSDTSSSQNPASICYNTPGTYNASLTVTTNYGCKTTLTRNQIIHAYPWPIANFGLSPDKANATDPVFSFSKSWSSDVTKWYWDFGDGSTVDSSSTNPVHSYSAAAPGNDFYSYTVLLNVINKYGCTDKIERIIEILPDFSFFMANCFTPNGDSKNEYYFGKGRGIKDYTLWIFDRWGHQIWTCHSEGSNVPWDFYGQDGMPSACKWDGTYNGTMVQQDVYVWKAQLVDVFDEVHSYVGRVTVVK